METKTAAEAKYQKVTVWDIKEFLRDYPNDLAIIISKDGEGNLFSPMASGVRVGRLVADDPFLCDFEEDDENPSCLAFFPVS